MAMGVVRIFGTKVSYFTILYELIKNGGNVVKTVTNVNLRWKLVADCSDLLFVLASSSFPLDLACKCGNNVKCVDFQPTLNLDVKRFSLTSN